MIYLIKRRITIIITIIIIYIVSIGTITITFKSINNNPIDNIAISYIRNNIELGTRYGAIVSAGRNPFKKTEKSDTLQSVAYTIKTEKYSVVVYVKLGKMDDEWKVIDLDIKEARKIED